MPLRRSCQHIVCRRVHLRPRALRGAHCCPSARALRPTELGLSIGGDPLGLRPPYTLRCRPLCPASPLDFPSRSLLRSRHLRRRRLVLCRLGHLPLGAGHPRRLCTLSLVVVSRPSLLASDRVNVCGLKPQVAPAEHIIIDCAESELP